jgi:catechol 2,3-dioxygenase-like lactoylglutathione lyase family enzyme
VFREVKAYSGFAVDDIEAAKAFYGQTPGLDVRESHDQLELHLAGGTKVLIYPNDDHVPATFTLLNFPVDDVDAAVGALNAAGVTMARYDDLGLTTDEKGIFRGDGPTIAWFKDPAGNVRAVTEDDD